MYYPVWEPFVANSILIAVVAILHVFVSHFAIGGGLYLVLAETTARRRNDLEHLAYVEKHSKFFVLLTLVFGAVTGVGIWIIIGLIHPTGTGWLINNFVWGWATEWVFFFVEITAALIYYYGWKRLSAPTHLAIGWVYFVAAWLSLFIINGIITFMLTPGEWTTSGSFWDGFFNPTFWPSLFFRTFICLILAGLYATFTVAREKNMDLKIRLLRQDGILVLGSLILAALSGYWYYAVLPGNITAAILPGSIAITALQIMIFFAALLFLLTLLGSIAFPRKAGYISGMILLFCALVAFGGFEWAREAVRKPYLIHDFLYSNNLLISQVDSLPASSPMIINYSTGNRGRDIYLAACRSCHTYSGYMSLSDRLAGMDEEFIANLIPRLHYFIGKMPPFPGNEEDVAALADYLYSIADKDPLALKPGLPEEDKAKIAFDRRCGGCHTLTGHKAVRESFEGLDEVDTQDIIMMLGDLTDAMPPYTGSEEETRLLVEFLTGGQK
jgi:cytochrome bd-type quinol oxidase subunit 1/mono/diheme cytochrome c family protein